MKIQKPLLSCEFKPEKAIYPYACTPKIDGIRFLIVDGIALSRSFKPIRNKYIQNLLSSTLPNGIDGEITVGNDFQSSTSGIMSIEGEPDFKVWIFDYIHENWDSIPPFITRINYINSILDTSSLPYQAEILIPSMYANSYEEVMQKMEEYTLQGYEGLMLRDPKGTYKFGRSTNKENILLKVKKFKDAEAIIIGFEEKYSNQNELEKNELGYAKRSSAKSGLISCNTLGTLLVRDLKTGLEFGIGSGFTDLIRSIIWVNKEFYLGKLVKYKYMEHGVKDKPRHPVFLGIRDKDDM